MKFARQHVVQSLQYSTDCRYCGAGVVKETGRRAVSRRSLTVCFRLSVSRLFDRVSVCVDLVSVCDRVEILDNSKWCEHAQGVKQARSKKLVKALASKHLARSRTPTVPLFLSGKPHIRATNTHTNDLP